MASAYLSGKHMSAMGFVDNLRFLRALIARPRNVGAVLPSGPVLAATMARQIDLSQPGPVLELGPGTGAITAAILAHGVEPSRLIAVEYDEGLAGALKQRFPAVRVIQGDAFDLTHTLGTRDLPPFAAVVSGLPLLNFPHAAGRKLIEGALARVAPGAPFIQFSYGLHAPIAPPAGHSVVRAALVVRNVPPARVWVYRKV
jgi:phosphatidylethanolamine/phosphatidyl-N-methylethanolamine N-methyltransferase